MLGKAPLTCQPSSRIGENSAYGMIGGIEETSASFEVRSAPRSYPTEAVIGRTEIPQRSTDGCDMVPSVAWPHGRVTWQFISDADSSLRCLVAQRRHGRWRRRSAT